MRSKHNGVSWQITKGKWRGQCYDVSVRYDNGSAKLICTDLFVDDEACHEALQATRREVAAKNASLLKEMAGKLDLTRDLPPRPKDPADGVTGTAYYGPAGYKAIGADVKEFRPDRFARFGNGKLQWHSCCKHGIGANACAKAACPRVLGEAATHCLIHGGGCPHGAEVNHCWQCSPETTEESGYNCSRCKDKWLSMMRRKSQNGNGLCFTCEGELEAAAAAIKGVPAAKKRRLVHQHENEMKRVLLSMGYKEWRKGGTPPPGYFSCEFHFNFRCATEGDFRDGERTYARVDFVVHPKKGGKLVFLEIDENQHKGNYTVLCDSTRMWTVNTSMSLSWLLPESKSTPDATEVAKPTVGEIKVLWVRFNPDSKFSIGDAPSHNPSNTERCEAVCRFLDAVEGKESDPSMEVVYAFYNMSADCSAKVVDDATYCSNVKEVVSILKHEITDDGSFVLVAYKI